MRRRRINPCKCGVGNYRLNPIRSCSPSSGKDCYDLFVGGLLQAWSGSGLYFDLASLGLPQGIVFNWHFIA
jgi:hypothetical protein